MSSPDRSSIQYCGGAPRTRGVSIGDAISVAGDAANRRISVPSVILEPSLLQEQSMGMPINPRSKLRLAAVMSALFLTMFIAALNTVSISTAVPSICVELDSVSGYAWIGAAHLLADAAAAPIWAKLSDIWGRKLILLTAITLYFGASTVCATANTMRILIAGRSMQGAAAGGLIQVVHIVISDLFDLRRRALYVGLLEIMWAIAGAVGPVLAGTVSQLLSWRLLFWTNLPMCSLAFGLLFLFLDVHNPKTPLLAGLKAVDWAGIITLLGCVLMILLGLNFGGSTYDWDSPQVLALIIVGISLLGLFAFCEAKLARHPLMPLSIFNNRSNVATLFVMFSTHYAYFSSEYYLPLYFQSARSSTPMISGTLLLPSTITSAIFGLGSGLMIYLTGRYVELIMSGLLLLALGNGLYIKFKAEATLVQVIAYQVVSGMGAGILFPAPTIALQAQVSPEDTATALGTLGFARSLATSFAAVIGCAIIGGSMDLQSARLQNIGLSAEDLQKLAGPHAVSNMDLIGKFEDPVQMLAARQAFAWSMRYIWVVCVCLAGIGLCHSIFIEKGDLNREHVEMKTGLDEKADG